MAMRKFHGSGIYGKPFLTAPDPEVWELCGVCFRALAFHTLNGRWCLTDLQIKLEWDNVHFHDVAPVEFEHFYFLHYKLTSTDWEDFGWVPQY